MTYLDRSTDERGRIEFSLHFNYQDALLLRQAIKKTASELEALYFNNQINPNEYLGLNHIKKLINIDRNEAEFRIKKLNHYLAIIENGLHPNNKL